MQEYVISLLVDLGYIGIMFLITLECIIPPIPSELVLLFAGYLTTTTSLTVVLFIVFATIGSYIGALFLYFIGRCIPVDKLEKLIGHRYIRRLGFKPEHLEKSLAVFNKYDKITILVGRCIPIIRSLISIPAGMEKMSIGKFSIYTLIGSVIWNTIFICLGVFAGKSWDKVLLVVDSYKYIVMLGVLLVGIVIYMIIKKWKNKN